MQDTDEMDIRGIEAFIAVFDFGGFTRAAEGLHLSQPALSRRIGLLEEELGQPLFERGRRAVHLTDAGRTFLPHAQAALASLRDGAAAVQGLAGGNASAVTFAIVGTLASTGITHWLESFHKEHPNVRILLRTGNSAGVSGLVRRGEAALGLRYFADPSSDVVSQILYREPLVVVAASGHPLARVRHIAPERLRGESWVAFPSSRSSSVGSLRQVLDRLLAAAGLDGSEVVAIDSLTAQKRLVEAGFGLALVQASSVEEELRLGTLRTLDVPAFRADVDVALIHRKGAFLSPAARWLTEVLGRVSLANGNLRPSGPMKRRR